MENQEGPKWLSRYKNKEKRRKYHREYQRKYMKWYRKTHPSYNSNRKDYEKRLRQRTLEKLGGAKCSECGCNIFEALEINHVDGSGNKERNAYKGYNGFLRDIIYERISLNKYNILCRVCNAKHDLERRFGIKGHVVRFKPL